MTVSEALSQAWQFHQAGQLQPAQQIYQQILQVDPNQPVATHRLGLIAQQTGDPATALALYQRAVTLAPGYADAQVDLGCLLRDSGKLADSIDAFRHALVIDPHAVIALHNLGDALTEQGEYEQALPFFTEALEIRPDLAESHCSLGNLWKKQGKTEEAIACYRRAIELKPSYAAPYNNLGVVLSEKGDLDDAITSFQKALQLVPGDADACNNLGRTFHDQGKHDQAVLWCKRAVELKPRFTEAIANLGKALLAQRKYQEAAAYFRIGITLSPADPEAHLRLGNALMELDQPSDAALCYRKVLELNPDSAEGESNLGMALLAQDKFEAALQLFENVLERHPDHIDSHYNLADTLMMLGDYPRGFREYEYRWKRKDAQKFPLEKPRWEGESLVGKTLLLVCEQGLGDTIQFIRFAPKAKELGGTILFGCVKPLVKLLANIPGIDQVIPDGNRLPEYDFYVPLMSLPGILGTTLEEIPSVLPVPYLKPVPELVEYWARRLGPKKPGELRVGLSWQGNPKHDRDRYRSISLEALVPLASVPGLRLVSFQKNYGVEQIAPMAGRLPLTCFEDEPGRQVDSFLDSAALMSLMDVMISVDSAPVHLAGALGVPTWLLCRVHSEWRWMLHGEDSLWYPSVRIFRQTSVSRWDDVVDRITRELKKLTPTPAGTTVTAPVSIPDALRIAAGFQERGQPLEAREICRQVLSVFPAEATVFAFLGQLALAQGNSTEAIAAYRKAPVLQPDLTQAAEHLGELLTTQNALEEARTVFERALQFHPRNSLLHGGLGTVYKQQNDRARALACFRRAVEIDPGNAMAQNNLGVCLSEVGEVTQAVACYQRALASQSNFPAARHNLGHALLTLGDYSTGFPEFEYRWLLPRATKPDFPQPRWNGEPLAGKTILLLSEHGLGDTIHLVRFAAELKRRGATVLFGCFRSLVKLLAKVPGVDRLVPEGDPLPEFDFHAPLMSLPAICKTALDDVPHIVPVPYLQIDHAAEAYWRGRLGPRAEGELRVGLVWQGNPTHVGDAHRSIRLERFLPLAKVPGIRLFSFQKNAGVEQIAPLANNLPLICLQNEPGRQADPFVDTAAQMAQMDVILTVDSAPVHVAGALGLCTWLLCPINPDWRWLLDRQDSPWYPSVRIFRQTIPGAWDDVFDRVVHELQELARLQRA